MNTRDRPDNLQHRLHYSKQDQRRLPWIADIDHALRKNADCEQCVMVKRGWAYSRNGPNSMGDHPELLVLIAEGSWKYGSPHPWYGHVFHGLDEQGHGCWVSMLARLYGPIVHGADNQSTLEEYKRFVIDTGLWMGGYQQQVGDIVSAHAGFEEAVAALIDKIQRFKRALREEQVVGEEEHPWGDGKQPIHGAPPNSEYCMKVFKPYCEITDAIANTEE